MNGYLVPANAKRGTLILNIFRPFDLILFGSGVFVSFLILMFVSSTNTTVIIIGCLPALITGLLVIPIPNYHNVLTAIQSIIRFFTERRRYVWKGWCLYEQFKDDRAKK